MSRLERTSSVCFVSVAAIFNRFRVSIKNALLGAPSAGLGCVGGGTFALREMMMCLGGSIHRPSAAGRCLRRVLLFVSLCIIHREISCGGGARKRGLCKGPSTDWENTDWKREKGEGRIRNRSPMWRIKLGRALAARQFPINAVVSMGRCNTI